MSGPVPLAFDVPGVPAPKGSLRAFSRGKHVALVWNNADKVRPWMSSISLAARDAGATPVEGPVSVGVTFRLPRPKGHYGAKGLKASAPLWPAKKPDVDKLVRALFDALKNVVWRDDAQVADVRARKFYEGPPAPYFVMIGDDPAADLHPGALVVVATSP